MIFIVSNFNRTMYVIFQKIALNCEKSQKCRPIEILKMTYASIGNFLSAPEQRSIFSKFVNEKNDGKNRCAAKNPSNRTNAIKECIKRRNSNRSKRVHGISARCKRKRCAGNRRKCVVRRVTGNESKRAQNTRKPQNPPKKALFCLFCIPLTIQNIYFV